ncbi:ribonuclease domain-containing protein [Butyrivibrio sp. NC2007]|uniref:ribonuclease domain-containing protein n=1 Tax=Butyrivibrio sp. NC2007 TaxID=1280683 RepID=UPI0003B499D9|nr:ribonuclease domain-containing protein [Butyrivibrio sp. NC2007]
MNLTRKKRSRLKVLPLILIISMFLLFTGCQKKPVTQQPGQTTATEQTTTTSTGQTTEASEATTLISLPTEAPDNTSTDAGAKNTSTDAASKDASQKTATVETSGKDETSSEATQAASTDVTSSNAVQAASTTDATSSDASKATSTTEAASTAATAEKSDKSSDSSAASQSSTDLIPENGTYTTKEDVALYIHTYGKLPQNFITKKAAKKLGWQGGSLEEYAPGKCIGGDYFGNYEGLLPEDKEYHECDICTLGKSKRGAKRIIYSDDGYIYYTGDHYESFELLYEP